MIAHMDTPRICKIPDCTNVLKKNDGRICQVHRSRWFRHRSYDISPDWSNLKKGKPSLTKLGYIRIFVDNKRVLEHRYVMEQYLGGKLREGERIHHINGDKTDNRIENLELFSNNAEHMLKHHPEEWKKRKISPEYSEEEIDEILKRLTEPVNIHNSCFCGRAFMARNLCGKHYNWAYKHNLFNIHHHKK